MLAAMNHTPPLHVVLGAGQIGTRLAALLLARGHRVRQARRGPPGAAHPRLEWVTGDLADPRFAAQVTRGAAVVYDCTNPPYHRWPELLLPLAGAALHGAAVAGARLVALDNLYMYGRPDGPLSEDSPVIPCSRKGHLRAELGVLRLAAHRRGDVRVAIGRASDFFGPDLPSSLWSERFYRRLLAGRPIECPGDPDMPHAYSYADDVAHALVVLGERDEAPGRIWHLPTSPAESTRALATRLGEALGLEVKVVRLPRLALRALGIFSPVLREMVEMVYQWEVPFALDDTRFRTTFGMVPTPIEAAVASTAAWARRHYALPALPSQEHRPA
jgi:nucleoside-diphosphate-sugar epimerase